jgi:hypothetical protein
VRLPRLTYANAASTLALFLALAGGSAYAATLITSANIQDETIVSADIKNGGSPAVAGTECFFKVTSATVPPGGVTGKQALGGPYTVMSGNDLNRTSDLVELSAGTYNVEASCASGYPMNINGHGMIVGTINPV